MLIAAAAGALALGANAASSTAPRGVLAYAKGGGIVLSRLDGTNGHVVGMAPRAIDSLALSPAGDRVAASYPDGSLDETLVATRHATIAARIPGFVFPARSWSADGRRLVTDASPSLERTCGHADRVLRLRVWTPSGRLIRTIDALTTAQVHTRAARTSDVEGATWSLAETQLAYAVRDWGCDRNDYPGTTIMIANVATGVVRVVYRGPVMPYGRTYAGDPSWSPDGTIVAFTDDCEVGNGCDRIVVVDVQTGKATRYRLQGYAATTVLVTSFGVVYAADPAGDGYVTSLQILDLTAGKTRRFFGNGTSCITSLDAPVLKLVDVGRDILVLDDSQACALRARTFVGPTAGGLWARIVQRRPGMFPDDAVEP